MYIDKLGNTVDKYNKTYYIEQEKWSLLMLRQGHVENTDKDPRF